MHESHIKPPRNSNIEALRILAMFMILMLHANYLSLGSPTHQEAIDAPIHTFCRVSLECVCIISVNLFVLISGWFTIRFTIKRLCAFLFQCVFVISVVYLIGLSLGLASIKGHQLLECLFMTQHGWFIKAYIALMILSPALNFFIENATRKEYTVVLISFFTFQTMYGCLTSSTKFIVAGYSTFSFIGLYLLAQYIRKYWTSIAGRALQISVISIIILVVWAYGALLSGNAKMSEMTLDYTNPFIISLAVGVLLLAIRREPVHNRTVNYIASSMFAVYICHGCNTWTIYLFKDGALGIYKNYSGLEYIGHILIFLLSFFVGAILIDQIRKIAWDFVNNHFTITPP